MGAAAIRDRFNQLKANGLQASNPDQSYAMFEQLKVWEANCRSKGFSEHDIGLMMKLSQELID